MCGFNKVSFDTKIRKKKEIKQQQLKGLLTATSIQFPELMASSTDAST